MLTAESPTKPAPWPQSEAAAVAADLARNRRKNDDPLGQADADAASRFEAQYRALTREA